ATELKKVSLAGGSPITLVADVSGGPWGFGAWTEDGSVIFASTTNDNPGLHIVSAEGGQPRQLTKLEGGERAHTVPVFVPASRSVLFPVVGAGFNERRVHVPD